MAINVGSILVESDGSHSGSGASYALFLAELAIVESTTSPEVQDMIAEDPSIVFESRQVIADLCLARAQFTADVVSGVYGSP